MTQRDPVHEIAVLAPDHRVGTDGTVTVSLFGQGRMFKRRAIKRAGTPESSEECWLVAELGDVRVYQRDMQIIVTRQDMNP